MKNILIIISIIGASLFLVPSCTIKEQVDPNKPSIEGFEENATKAQLNNLVTGTLYQMRVDHNIYIDGISVIGREIYRFSGSDPRYTSDLLNGTLDNNAFYSSRPFAGRYRTVKNLNILLQALDNTSQVTDAEKEGYRGFVKTIMAHELLMVLNQLNENGLRLDVADPDNLGPFVSKEEAFVAIAAMLEEGATHLDAAGDDFAFSLASGFAGFDAPATFKQFNRALAARVAVYRGEYDDALTFLTQSFFDINEDLNIGAFHTFSTTSGDLTNPLFLGQNSTGEVRVAHPAWITEAEDPADTRLSKATERTPKADDGPGPASSDGLTGNYDVWVYQSNTASIPIIRNEELILLYAEANIHIGDLTEAVVALDVVRIAAGLSEYSGEETESALINEMLEQRRYSLWFEGHRWIDMRRYNKLDELPLDRTGDLVHTDFPVPFEDAQVLSGTGS